MNKVLVCVPDVEIEIKESFININTLTFIAEKADRLIFKSVCFEPNLKRGDICNIKCKYLIRDSNEYIEHTYENLVLVYIHIEADTNNAITIFEFFK